MPTNYPANPLAVQPPSPPPGPGVTPTLALPIDNEGGAASLYQPFKSNGDLIAHIQKSTRFDTAIASPGTGFSAVTHSGSGAGTITPGATAVITGGQAKTAAGLRVLIRIVTPGAPGTATFQTSLDGGNTWGTVQTTAGSGATLDATSGVVQTMAGTFAAGDTYGFRSAFTPLASWPDAVGKNRALISHNGFAGGQVVQCATNWDTSATDGGRWQLASGGGGVSASVLQAPTGLWHGRCLNLQTIETTSGAFGDHQTTLPIVDAGDPFLSFEMEWIASAPSAPTNLTYIMGLGAGSISAASSYGYRAWFKKANGDTNWQLQYQYNSGSITSVDSGVAGFTAGAFARFKIEIQGENTPIGLAFSNAVALFFINEKLVGALAMTPASQPFTAIMDIETTGTVSVGNVLQVGPVRWRFNLVDVDVAL
jgi:hypothetical protein